MRSLLQHLHAAALEGNIEGVLLIHMDLRSAAKETCARYLHDSDITATRHILKGDWPTAVSCNEIDIPRYRAIACVVYLLGSKTQSLLNCDKIGWDFFGPLNAPVKRFEDDDENETMSPGDLIELLTVEGYDPA